MAPYGLELARGQNPVLTDVIVIGSCSEIAEDRSEKQLGRDVEIGIDPHLPVQ